MYRIVVAVCCAGVLAGCQSAAPTVAGANCPPPLPPVQCPEPAPAQTAYVPIERQPPAHSCPPIPACPPKLIRIEVAKPAESRSLESRAAEQRAGETKMLDGKILVGEAEFASVQPGNLRLDARIDTGATTSSMHATNIKSFERDGQRWVRFTTDNGRGEAVTLELPRVRHVRIKGEGEDYERRPVVLVDVQIGKMKQKVEVSLTDRENYNFPLLVGRNFLRDHAVVDVGRKYVQGGANSSEKSGSEKTGPEKNSSDKTVSEKAALEKNSSDKNSSR